MKLKLQVYLAFVGIILICWLGYHFIFESKHYAKYFLQHRILKHVLNFIWLLLITALGYWGLKYSNIKWAKQLWLIINLSVIVFLLLIGLIDLIFSPFNLNIITGFAYLRYFFQSPLPFIMIIALTHVDLKNVNKSY